MFHNLTIYYTASNIQSTQFQVVNHPLKIIGRQGLSLPSFCKLNIWVKCSLAIWNKLWLVTIFNCANTFCRDWQGTQTLPTTIFQTGTVFTHWSNDCGRSLFILCKFVTHQWLLKIKPNLMPKSIQMAYSHKVDENMM